MNKVIAYKWFLNEDTQTSTGKEYTVQFSKEAGVEKIISVFAVEKHSTIRVDITQAEIQGNNLDAHIDRMFDWHSLAAEQTSIPRRDAFFYRAAAIARFHAESYRH